jgi:hypothetical protein
MSPDTASPDVVGDAASTITPDARTGQGLATLDG